MHKLILTLTLMFALTGAAFAQTREQCELDRVPALTRTVGTTTGGLVGTATGATACSGLLGFIFADLGFSYAVCVAAVAAAGTISGAAVAEGGIQVKRRHCASLPSESQTVLAGN